MDRSCIQNSDARPVIFTYKKKIFGGNEMRIFLNKNSRYLLVPILICILAFILFFPVKPALVFEYQNTGNVLAYLPLNKMDSFKIKYTHSIHLSSVVESYNITKNNEIKQYELMYEDFAIGMPANATEGEIFEEKDGKYFIRNMKRTFPSFDLRVGKVRANHTIIYKDKEYPLKNSITPGTWIHIQAKRINLFQIMRGVDILES
jgi:hypothetical protein